MDIKIKIEPTKLGEKYYSGVGYRTYKNVDNKFILGLKKYYSSSKYTKLTILEIIE